ncbi:SDR family NAD(P)-dependent oxidoreductase [Qipengyuania sp. DSG2-2]|uniref:SDR family NAD(P)-dependent oxidoreductase n=1 Tax=Qipengyuania sp. DGS2-2 TaxID=3349631 RepID=UPI0036D36869
MSDFGFESTADEVLAGMDLTGKTALITGGYSGLGQETARAMAARGAHVIVAGRDEAKADAAVAEIKEATGNEQVEAFVCDLGNQAQLREAGKEARERFDKIDLLINNAGVMACPYAETADGHEMQFGTNHLGHFTLTNELLPLVEKGTNPRIVNLSSRGHHMGPVDLDDPNFDNRDYEKWASYGQAKTANILHAVGLEKRLSDKGIHAYAVHPGGIQTNLGRHLSEEDAAALMQRVQESDSSFQWKTIPQGAATTCYAATAPELEGQGGVYLEDCQVAELDDESANGGVRSYAVDPAKAKQLWILSERLAG